MPSTASSKRRSENRNRATPTPRCPATGLVRSGPVTALLQPLEPPVGLKTSPPSEEETSFHCSLIPVGLLNSTAVDAVVLREIRVG